MASREILTTLSDEKLLALLLWHEARGEPWRGKLAVAHVVLNRVSAQSWYGRTIQAVMLYPYQFSCFNGDTIDIQYDDECTLIAQMAIGGATFDVTGGCTHYFNPDLLEHVPVSYLDRLIEKRIGLHIFYRPRWG